MATSTLDVAMHGDGRTGGDGRTLTKESSGSTPESETIGTQHDAGPTIFAGKRAEGRHGLRNVGDRGPREKCGKVA